MLVHVYATAMPSSVRPPARLSHSIMHFVLSTVYRLRLVVVATPGWRNGPLLSTRSDDDDDDDVDLPPFDCRLLAMDNYVATLNCRLCIIFLSVTKPDGTHATIMALISWPFDVNLLLYIVYGSWYSTCWLDNLTNCEVRESRNISCPRIMRQRLCATYSLRQTHTRHTAEMHTT